MAIRQIQYAVGRIAAHHRVIPVCISKCHCGSSMIRCTSKYSVSDAVSTFIGRNKQKEFFVYTTVYRFGNYLLPVFHIHCWYDSVTK